MRLELGTFPVKEVTFGGRQTRWSDGLLEIDRVGLLKEIRSDPRIATVDIHLAKPGESVRIWPVRDVIEPRVKVEGPGVVYPGICDRPITSVGQGRTHRLSGIGVVEVSEVPWHAAGHDWVSTFLDMAGPWANYHPYSSLINVCVVVEPVSTLNVDVKNRAVHQACLTVSDRLAMATRSLRPPQTEVFEIGSADPSLPNVVFIMCLHSSQATSGNPNTFCTSIYGSTELTPPWALHPNEVLDGAVTGPYRTVFATSWMLANNPILLELYRRHGKEFNFIACITMRTEWTTQREKDLIAQETAKLAWMLGARGAIVTWDAGGNEEMEVVRVVQACEKLGIKAVYVTSEFASSDGVATILVPVPELDAITSTGCFRSVDLGLTEIPGVSRAIGSQTKLLGSLRDRRVPTSGPLPPPGIYDDHYGFTRNTCIEY